MYNLNYNRESLLQKNWQFHLYHFLNKMLICSRLDPFAFRNYRFQLIAVKCRDCLLEEAVYMRGHDECSLSYFFFYVHRIGAAHDVNTIVNSLCLDAPVIVFCAVEAPLGIVFSREDRRDLPIFTRLFPREFRICLGKWQDNTIIFP